MRTRWATVTDDFREYNWEVVDSVEDVATAFDAEALRMGLDPHCEASTSARARAMTLAHLLMISTVGDVLRVEDAWHTVNVVLLDAGLKAPGSTRQ